MAITPPSTWNALDSTPTGEFRTGATVDSADVQDLCENHNALYGGQGFPLGGAFYGTGWTGAVGPADQDSCVFIIPDTSDATSFRYSVSAANGGGVAADIYIRVVDGGSPTDYTHTIAGSTAETEYTGSHTFSNAGPWYVIIGSASPDVSVYSVHLSHPVLSGSSVSDAGKSSGFRWTQPTQIADDEPLPVELLNRMFAAPHQIYTGTPHCLGSIADSPQAPRIGLSESTVLTGPISGTDWAPHGYLTVDARFACRCVAYISGRKITSGAGSVILDFGAGVTVTVTLSSTTTPAAKATPTFVESAAFQLPAGPRLCRITCVGAEVWGVQIFTNGA